MTQHDSFGSNLRKLTDLFQPPHAKKEETVFYGELPLTQDDSEHSILSAIATYHFYMSFPVETIQAFRKFAESCLRMYQTDWASYNENEDLMSTHLDTPVGHLRYRSTIQSVIDYFHEEGLDDFFDEHDQEILMYEDHSRLRLEKASDNHSEELFLNYAACAIRFLGALSEEEEKMLWEPKNFSIKDLSPEQRYYLSYIFNGPHFFMVPSQIHSTEMIFHTSNPFLALTLESEIEGFQMDYMKRDFTYLDLIIPHLETILRNKDTFSELIDISSSQPFNKTVRHAFSHFAPSFFLPREHTTDPLYSIKIPTQSFDQHILAPKALVELSKKD